MSEPRARYLTRARATDQGDDQAGEGALLDVRLSGPPELVDEALSALRLVLRLAEVSRPYANRRGAPGGERRYLKAVGVTPEARRFLRAHGDR